jgi:6-phosphogluconolactonase
MTRADVADHIADAFEKTARAAASVNNRVAVAVPGGSVGRVVFPRFAALTLDWSRVDVTWVDERVVSPDHPDSNVRATRRHWLDLLPSPGPRIIAPPFEGSVEQVSRAWEASLVAALGTPPRLDVAMLGVGPDGHVASLFPNHPALACEDAWVVGITDAPKPPPVRVSLTRAALAHASELWIVAFGREKAAAIREARHNRDSRLPLARVITSGPLVRWFLDGEAASD